MERKVWLMGTIGAVVIVLMLSQQTNNITITLDNITSPLPN